MQIANLSHRLRLTGMLTVSVSITLGLVFLAVFAIVRSQTMERRLTELSKSVERVAHEWNGPASLSEEKEDFPGSDFTVFARDGAVLASTSVKPLLLVHGSQKIRHQLYAGIDYKDVTVVGSLSWLETEAGLKQLALVLAGLWLPITILAGAVAWYGGGLVLRPVTELVSSADRLSSWSDERLLETTDHAEFAHLAQSLNQMIGRVRHAAKVQEQFASDAAHELRSPLAVLRTGIEATLLNPRTPEQHEEALRSMLGQVERLGSIVETLLASARADSDPVPPLALEPIVARIVDDWRISRDWDASRVVFSGRPESALVSEDELAIVVRNFLDNAARYSPTDRPIEVRVEPMDSEVRLSVRDFGPGLSTEAKTQAFQRFYRVDEARNRQDGGVGIGLAVVKRIVESRGGRVGFENPSEGTLVWAVFPKMEE
ncbi:MAG: HAMP domain-containing protein [Armatimonadetes bacterium]|nr:HAMP domain-containing protein [Armatimonadota bacterium]